MKNLLARRELSLLVAIILIVGVAIMLQPRFASEQNIRSILLWVPLLAVAAMGQTAVIITRGIDVSVGSILGLAGMTTAILLRDYPQLGVGGAAVIGIGLGAVLGAINGGMIAFAKVPPIVATLGTLGIYRGLTFIVSGGRQVDDYQLPKDLMNWSLEGPSLLSKVPFLSTIPWVVWIAIIVMLLSHLGMTYTRYGRDVYALGGNPDAAALRGIPVNFVTFMAYVLCGIGGGFAGVLYASRYGTVNPSGIGNGFELQVIAAVVIGGVSVFGGTGGAPGVALSCLLLGVVNVALSVLAIADTWQMAIYGLVLLVAIIADERFARSARKRAGEAV